MVSISSSSSSSSLYDIVIFGATGFTGQRVAEYLQRLIDNSTEANVTYAVAGRNIHKLKGSHLHYHGIERDTLMAVMVMVMVMVIVMMMVMVMVMVMMIPMVMVTVMPILMLKVMVMVMVVLRR